MNTRTEHYTGADCTGNSGDSNRTLTLSNTAITSDDGFLIYVSGLAIALNSEYTVNHNLPDTIVTFLNPVWDDQTVIAQYVQQKEGAGSQVDADDFILGPLADLGVEVVRTPVTVETNYSGNKTYTDGTDETIEVVFVNPDKNFDLDKAGLTEVYDAIMNTKSDETINKYDKITYDSKVYRVETVNPRNFNGTTLFKMVGLYFLADE